MDGTRIVVTIGTVEYGAHPGWPASVSTTSNVRAGENIRIEVEIVTAGISIKAHRRAPQSKTCYVCGITLATKTSIQSGLL
jgi:hypothetical protein